MVLFGFWNLIMYIFFGRFWFGISLIFFDMGRINLLFKKKNIIKLRYVILKLIYKRF